MSKLCPVCGTTYLDALVFCPADGTTLRAADLQGDLVGSVVADRYLVTDLLGEGGMGTVYLARHVRLPQQAAIKVLRKDMLRDAAAVARFNREAANASRIDHDRVARVYDFGETEDGTVYLAMEYVQGKTIKTLLAEGGPMAPPRVAGLVRQIAEGLDAAHRMGIVHRDLKPDNILVIDDGDAGERVKVVDFGIAKAFGGEEAGRGLTRTGMVVGTPEFMSPEQLLGEPLDARSDIYALAIVAYQCLTGDLPFASNTPDHGMTARLMTPPRPLIAVRPSVQWSPGVQRVFDLGLARQPGDRPASAGAFARALAASLDEWLTASGMTGVRARPATAPPAPQASSAPPPAVTPVAAPPAPAPAASPTQGVRVPARNPSRTPLLLGAIAAVIVAGGAGIFIAKSYAGGSRTAVAPTSTGTPVGDTSAATRTVPPAPSNTPAASGAAQAPNTVPNATPRTAGGVASAASGAPPAAPRTAPPATPAVTGGLTSVDAKHTLDSIATALDPSTADESAARAAVRKVRELMPRLTNATDSTWATLRMTEAYLLLNDVPQACAAVRVARPLARSADQREAVSRYARDLSC